MMVKQWLAVLVSALLVMSPVLAQETPSKLTLVTHDSFAVSEEVLQKFQDETGITVETLRSGDAGTMVNQSILSKENPLGDVMFGVDNTFLGRALENDLFIPYESPLLKDVSDEFKLDPENRVTPVDYGDVCLNYDVDYFQQENLAVPHTLDDLTKPDYKSLLVVENPATSSPGLAFLLATIAHFGTEGDHAYLDFWRELLDNDVYISDDWSDAYYTQFSGSSGQGARPLVVSYASSPPAEVYFADPAPATAPTASIIADGMCFRQIEFVGILNGTPNTDAAQKFVDFMLSVPFQEDMPLQMFVFPVNDAAKLPEVFTQYAVVPEKPVVMDIQEINTNREQWLQAWTETVLR
jgi:thiamine transport system substrate-binding protein